MAFNCHAATCLHAPSRGVRLSRNNLNLRIGQVRVVAGHHAGIVLGEPASAIGRGNLANAGRKYICEGLRQCYKEPLYWNVVPSNNVLRVAGMASQPAYR